MHTYAKDKIDEHCEARVSNLKKLMFTERIRHYGSTYAYRDYEMIYTTISVNGTRLVYMYMDCVE